MSNKTVRICSFDHELRDDIKEPPVRRKNMTENEKDSQVLRTSKRISIFWITENARRAKFIQGLEDSGRLKLDNSCGYPWMTIVEFQEAI